MSVDLSLIPIERLFEEISNRTESAIFAYERYEGDDLPTKPSLRTLFKGEALACVGLCELMKNHIINQYDDYEA